MWQLDYRKYDIVHLKNTAISPWIVNPDSLTKIQHLTDFIREIKENMSTRYLRDTYDSLHSLYRKERPQRSYSPDEICSILGMVSHSLPASSFLDHVEFNQHKETTDCVLFSEKNLIPQLIGKGSSRHALGTTYQFKGIGRNAMAHAEDYYHSWGGYVSRDALRSLICDQIITERTKLGCVRTDAIFKYDEKFLENTPLVLALRENDCYRLSQITPIFLSKHEKRHLIESLYQRFKNQDLAQILQSIIDHYVHAFSVGIIHKSISQENLTLDGRFLDTDSIEYEETTRACPYYIKLGFQVENTEILKEATPLKDVLRPGDKTNFYRTWLHDLMLASELTANAFQILSGQQYDWKKYCLDACQKYLNEDYKKWIPLLRYESYARKFLFSSEFPIESIEWSLELDELCENSTCTGSFYDLHTHLQLNSFTTTPDRMRKNSMLTLMKYDLAFWNKPLSWDNAFANWKLINFQRLKNHE